MLAPRPPSPARLDWKAPDCVIGVDLGGTKILAGAVGRDLAVGVSVRRAVPAGDADALLRTVAEAVSDVRERTPSTVLGVGFGIPCLIDSRDGVAVSSVHLPIAGIPFASAMSERLGLPAFVDNDATLAMLAEHSHGAAQGARNAAMLTLGTGIGGGLVIDGRIYRGSRGAAGELGHMVVCADGPDCGPGCPSRGCLEAFASGTALAREALCVATQRPSSGLGRALAAGREIDGPLVTELARAGDPTAVDLLSAVGGWLGIGLASLANILNPDVIVVGGGVSAAGELLLAPARTVLTARALGLPGSHVQVLAAHFGAQSGMLGGALLAYDSLDRRAS